MAKDTPDTSERGEFRLVLHGMTITKNGQEFSDFGPATYVGLNEEQVVAVEQVVIGGLLNLGIESVKRKKQ